MRGETILCISPRNWDALWRDTQQVMSRIAVQNRVLYFEPGRDGDLSVASALRRNLPNLFTLRIQEIDGNLYVIPTPPRLPHARRYLPSSLLQVTMPLIIKLNVQILARQVRRAIKALDVKDPILWLYSQYDKDLVGRFGEKLSCYYNVDEVAEFSDNKRIKTLIYRLDDELTSAVDVVFATSRGQWTRRAAVNPHTYFIPNGVDFDLFNRALGPDLPLPDDIVAIPRPIIGFIGWMGFHIDVELLIRIARHFPAASLVLIGPEALPQAQSKKTLFALPNVFYLGEKQRSELPGYLQVFDVALMPYLASGHILSAYPLKLHEYLAAGRAIVSTALPELYPYRKVVHIAETHADFLQQIDKTLHENTPQAIASRVAVARENTWDQRILEIYRILEAELESKRPASVFEMSPENERRLL